MANVYAIASGIAEYLKRTSASVEVRDGETLHDACHRYAEAELQYIFRRIEGQEKTWHPTSLRSIDIFLLRRLEHCFETIKGFTELVEDKNRFLRYHQEAEKLYALFVRHSKTKVHIKNELDTYAREVTWRTKQIRTKIEHLRDCRHALRCDLARFLLELAKP